MTSAMPGAICMDCLNARFDSNHKASTEDAPGFICEHWQPEHWESRGYQRDWGDAAVMNWPQMEILRKEEVTDQEMKVSFVILAPYAMRRPVIIYAKAPDNRIWAWGSY